MIIQVGRVCRIVRGKNAGRYCVIVEKIDKNFVKISGEGIKARRININHIEPLPKVLKIKKSDTPKKITELLKKEGF